MEAQATGTKLHPVLWVAAVAVIILSAAGVGAIFGVIPTVGSSSKPADPVAAAAPAPTASTPQPATATSPPAAVTKPTEPEHKPAPVKHKVVAKAPEISTEHPFTLDLRRF